MIKGLGTDILKVERIRLLHEKSPGKLDQRILTPLELELCRTKSQPYRFLAKRFCAKEAISKALGTGIGKQVSWQDMEITNQASGQPQVLLTGGALEQLLSLGASHCIVSISDEKDYVTATAIIQ